MSGIQGVQGGLLDALERAQRSFLKHSTQFATGRRINAGREDPAGLIASERLGAQIRALEAESRAIERNEALARTADGALAEAGAMLDRRESLAVAAANTGTMSDAERAAIQLEMDSIDQSVDRTLRSASFGGTPLFSGEVSIPTREGSFPLERPDADPGSIAEMRGRIGAFERNELGSRHNALKAEFENAASARSLILDTDNAKVSAAIARDSLLVNASVSLLNAVNHEAGRVFGVLHSAGRPAGRA